jgi:hypothetical protein
MPIYEVTQESTGLTLEVEGPTPPSKEILDQQFKQYAAMNPPQQKGFINSLTDAVLGPAPEVVTPNQPPAAPIKALEGVETTLRAPMTFRERLQQPEIQAKRFPALAALEGQVAESIGRTTITKPSGSRLEQEGFGAVFQATPEKREAYKQAFEAAGNLIGPKTAAAAGVIGEATADFLESPGSIATLGIGTGLRSVASIPKVLRAIEGGATASELQTAASTSRIAQNLERVAVAGFTKPTVESAIMSTRAAVGIMDSDAPAEDKVRAATQAGLSLLFTGLLGAGMRESFRAKTGLIEDAQAMEALAGRQISARDAALNLKKIREEIQRVNDEIKFAEATLPERGKQGVITPEQMRVDAEVKARLAETQSLMDRALNEAVAARVIDTGEMTAIEQLRAQGKELFVPEAIGEGPRPFTEEAPAPSMLEQRRQGTEAFAEPQEPTPLRTADEIRAQREVQRIGEPPPSEPAAVAPVESIPLETVAEKLKKSLAERDRTMAAQAVAEALESGAAQGEPAVVTRKLVEAQLGIGKEPAQSAQRLIFNELWDAEIQRQGVGTAAQTAKPTSIFKPGGPLEKIGGKELLVGDTVIQVIASPDNPSIGFITGLKGRDIAGKLPEVAEALKAEGFKDIEYRPDNEDGRAAARVRLFESIKPKLKQVLQEGPVQGRFSQAAESLTQSLENLRVDVTPGVGALPIVEFLGQSWNGALVVAQSMIKGGAKVADAIEKAVRYVKYDFQGKFDEAQLRSALSQALSESPKIFPGEGQKPRRTIEKMVASPDLPLEMRQQLAASPEASYDVQTFQQLKSDAASMTEAELATDIADYSSATRIASAAEIYNRRFNADDMQGATDMAKSVAKSGTLAAQLLNQMKLLSSTTPEGLVYMVTRLAEREGRKVDPKILSEIKSEMTAYQAAQGEVTKLEGALRYLTENNAPQESINTVSNALKQKDINFKDANDALALSLAKSNPSFANKILSTYQGSVLIPKSGAFNLLANVMSKPITELASLNAAFISQIESALTGKPPVVVYDWKARWPGRIASLKYAAPEAARALLKGADAGAYEPGRDFSQPLNFQRAWGELFEMAQNPATFSPKKAAVSLAEGTIGLGPDILLRTLAAGDILFKIADKRMFIQELGRQYGLTEGQIKLAERDLNLVKITDEQAKAGRKGLTQDQIDEINFEADRAVYQQENSATELVGKANRYVKNKFGTVPYLGYRVGTALFQKTPINVIAEGLTFTPGLGAVRNYKELSPREVRLVTSKQMIGAAAMSGLSMLISKGIITPMLDSADDTQKERNLSEAKGAMPAGTFNATGLNRMLKGGDPSYKPGDNVVYLEKLGLTGILANIVATAQRDYNKSSSAENKMLAIGAGAVAGVMNWVAEQQMVKGAVSFVKLLDKDYKRAFRNYALQTLETASSPFAPSILAGIDRAERPYVVNVRDEGILKTYLNKLNQRMNVIGVQVPGAMKANELPLLRDMWGEAIPQTPTGSVLGGTHPYLYSLVWPLKQKTIENDPLNAEMYRLLQDYDDIKIIPSIPDPKVELNKVKYEAMTPKQYDRYTQLIGFFRRQNAERLYFSSAFANASDKDRITILSSAFEDGLRRGKYEFLKELEQKGQSLTPVAPKRGFKPTQ